MNAADQSAVSCGAGNGTPRTVPTFIADVLATLAVALVLLCRGPGRADSPVTDRIVRWWAAVWLRAVGTRVTVRGLEHVSAATAYVVVANHQSNLDPMVHLQTLPLSLRILVKRELFRISRSPARCRSCLSPSMAPAASGRRGEPRSTAACCHA